jgi:glycosyltransferase involved in cell wall biosynthesis
MRLPLVTIGAINYNNASYVLETLNSISAQTYSQIELIVVDDASTDNSLLKIREWLSHCMIPYKLIVHAQNEGVHKAYESVIKNASGEFISFIATDDLFEPGKIQQQVEAFQQLDESYGVVYGDVVEINEQSKVISKPYFQLHQLKNKDWQLLKGDVFTQVTKEFLIYVQTTLIRTSLLRDFSFKYKALSEDWQFILYLARNTRFFGIDNVVVRYRRHALSISAQNRRREKYYLWCQSNVLMFLEAYNFPGNAKQEKRVIAKRIQFDLMDYAYQPKSKYSDVIRTWKKVKRYLPFVKSTQLFFLIIYLRVKLLIKRFLFPGNWPEWRYWAK